MNSVAIQEGREGLLIKWQPYSPHLFLRRFKLHHPSIHLFQHRLRQKKRETRALWIEGQSGVEGGGLHLWDERGADSSPLLAEV